MARRETGRPNAATEGTEIQKGGDGRYPVHLHACSEEELGEAGLRLDHEGRIRDGQAYVCAVSGRIHYRYLCPVQVPDPEYTEDGGRWSTIWVSGHEVRPEIRRTLIDRLVDAGTSAIARRF